MARQAPQARFTRKIISPKKSSISEPQAQSIVKAIDDASDFNLKDLDIQFSAATSSLQASFHSMQKALYSSFLILLTTMIATNLHH